MMWNDGWGSGQWVAMTFAMVVFWGIVIAVVITLARSDVWRRSDTPRVEGRDAEAILSERFARGEIGSDEFTRQRELLRQ